MTSYQVGRRTGRSTENLRTYANAVTLARTVISLLLFTAAAYYRNPALNLAGLAVYWIGDVADGFLARRFNQETLFGAQHDILADRMSVVFFYMNYLAFYPHLAPSIVLFLVQFTMLDQYLSNQYLRWPIMSPNYFYRVDALIWRLNWSKVGKASNTGFVTLLMLLTKSNWVVLPVVVALIAVKLYCYFKVLPLSEPITRQRVLGQPPEVIPAANMPLIGWREHLARKYWVHGAS